MSYLFNKTLISYLCNIIALVFIQFFCYVYIYILILEDGLDEVEEDNLMDQSNN